MRRRRLWRTVLGILASLAVSLVIAAWPGCSTFTVSTETTYITEPLDKDGYVDYVTALNERLSKGIKSEDNANVLIWQALGPHPEGATMPPDYFRWLAIESPPEDGEYFITWPNYRKAHLQADDRMGESADVARVLETPHAPWTAKDRPDLADWLRQNEKPLALVIGAGQRPQYYNPLVAKRTNDSPAGLIDALLPNVQLCRHLAQALVCRAMLHISEGKADEAWQDLQACHRLGRRIARAGTSVEFLVGLALDQVADTADVAFLEHAKLTSTQIMICLEDLRRLPPMPAYADKIDLGERFMLLDIIMLTAHYGTTSLESINSRRSAPPKWTARLFTRSINWDPAFRNANHWIDRYLAALRLTDREARVQELTAIKGDLIGLRREVASSLFFEGWFAGPTRRGELIGNILIGLMMPALDKVSSGADRTEQRQRNLHIAFALAAYQHDQGRYPATLAELAQKYLDKIPDDLFSGKPLIYRPDDKGYLLYSVGVNGINDEGRENDDDPPGDDLRIRIPIPPPRDKD